MYGNNTQLYTTEDVQRWLAADASSIPAEQAALNTAPPGRVDRVISYLSVILASHAQALLASRNYSGARQSLILSAAHQSDLYERFYRGEKINIEYINAGDFQMLLNALASNDWAVVQRFVKVFPPEFAKESRSIPSSVYIAQPLKALVEGRTEDAKKLLALPEPKPEPMFRGYTDCLRAIANKDIAAFMEALRAAAKHWRKWAARAERGLPGSVCFLHGAGFAVLAQRVMGQQVTDPVEDVPLDLLR